MAEGFFKDIIEKNKLNNIEIYSAGLGNLLKNLYVIILIIY